MKFVTNKQIFVFVVLTSYNCRLGVTILRDVVVMGNFLNLIASNQKGNRNATQTHPSPRKENAMPPKRRRQEMWLNRRNKGGQDHCQNSFHISSISKRSNFQICHNCKMSGIRIEIDQECGGAESPEGWKKRSDGQTDRQIIVCPSPQL